MNWVVAVLVLLVVAGAVWLVWRGRVAGWSDLFGPTAPRRAPISTSITITDDALVIDSLDFRGPCLRSPNRKFTLGWADAATEISGDHGHIILLIDRQVILHRRLPHPVTGAVSNIGTFAVADRRLGAEPGALFHVLSPYGDVLTRGRVRGEPTRCGISNNGRFAVCHTVIDTDASDGGMLYFFVMKMGPSGLKPGGLAWKLQTWPDSPEGFDIDIVRRQLIVRYADETSCEYSFDGDVLSEEEPEHDGAEASDVEESEDDAVEEAEIDDEEPDGRDLLERAEALIVQATEDEAEDEAEAWLEAKALLLEAASLEVPPRVAALVQRRLGEIAEHLEESDEAVARYEQALELNPKVGVKTRLAKLRRGTS